MSMPLKKPLLIGCSMKNVASAATFPGLIFQARTWKDTIWNGLIFVLPNLRDTDLSESNLKGAVLQNAQLQAADLSEADLYRADFSGADLTGADLDEAKVDGADFSGAIGVNLEGAKGGK
jgi:uncharacterized protein YjbI with pentapeptide repeats